MIYGHKFAKTNELPGYYNTYFGIERNTPTGFTLDSTAGVVWQPFFQIKEYIGAHMFDAFKSMPVISEIYRSDDSQCVLMENLMECDATDSAFNEKMIKELRAMQHFNELTPISEVLENVQAFYGKDARRLLNADTVLIVNYKFDRHKLYNIESCDLGNDFAYCTAIYAKRAGYAGHIGYLLMTKEGFANRDKYINRHNSAVRYIDGWKSSASLEASRGDVWWSFIQKENNSDKELEPIVR